MSIRLQIYKAIIFFLAIVLPCQAQQNRVDRADNKYLDRAYVDAAKIYERVARSGFESTELFQRLGNSYYFNALYNEASRWYEKLFALDNDIDPIYYLRYAQTLKSINEDEKADQVFNTFLEKSKSENNFKTAASYLKIIEQNSGRYDVTPASINTENIEFGGTLANGKYIFTSSNPKTGLIKRIDNWSGLGFLDLFEVDYNEDTGFSGRIKRLKKPINSKYHESSIIFTKDGNTAYLTRSNTSPGLKQDDDVKNHLKIYRITKDSNGKWGDFEDLSINGDTYSTAHPVLDPNEKTLYYVSDQPGGYGLTDIYKVSIQPDGSLGVPDNLGHDVNTKGRESFPYISVNRELYFSSDGHFGLGGYDVFYIDLTKPVLQMVNVGEPVNSINDDFAFFISGNKGAYSSNRPEGQGKDDIYLFTETLPIKEAILKTITGVVTDADTGKPLQNSKITVKDINNIIITAKETDDNGNYEISINRYYDHIIEATKPDYEGATAFIQVDDEINIKRDFVLKKNVLEITENIDLSDFLNIPPIYFEFDKSDITKEAKVELQKLVAFMNEYPEVKVLVRSHTDSRGTDEYNLKLSSLRAKATADYIISQGITPSRLETDGVGERELKNKCKDGVKCNENEHNLNRRSEYLIINKS